jgi:hypothetical protein
MTDDPGRAGALYKRADRLGCQIEPSPDQAGYCLWRIWPGSGRQMVLGLFGGVTLNDIAQKLDAIEADKRAKKSGTPQV